MKWLLFSFKPVDQRMRIIKYFVFIFFYLPDQMVKIVTGEVGVPNGIIIQFSSFSRQHCFRPIIKGCINYMNAPIYAQVRKGFFYYGLEGWEILKRGRKDDHIKYFIF